MALLILLETFFADVTDRIRRDDEGATAVEYGIMVALISVAIFVTVSALGVSLDGLFNAVNNCITGAGCVAP